MLVYAILGPLLLAVLLAWLQHVWYLGRVRCGSLPDEERPFFGILLFRGLLMTLGIVLIVVIALKRQIPLFEDDPALTPERRQAVIEQKYGSDDDSDEAEPPLTGEQDAELERLMDPAAGAERDEESVPPQTPDPAP